MQMLTKLLETPSVRHLDAPQVEHLKLLLSQWQLIADLGSSDLVLWVPTTDDQFIAVGLCRSATASTLHVDDPIGLLASAAQVPLLEEAMEEGKIIRPDSVRWAGLYSSMVEYIPVYYQGQILAVMTREANLSAPSRFAGTQVWAAAAANTLCHMVAEGTFPNPDAPTVSSYGAPRVADGVLLLDENGVVVEASPNANSSLRRLGVENNVVGRSLLTAVVEALVGGEAVQETVPVVLSGKAPWWVDIASRGNTVVVRGVPLYKGDRWVGAVLLTRDVTEMRRHEQELMTKDATIREIHHRVKNNLQSVSALLRIQQRRSDSEPVRQALQEAERRVQAIATVHDALTQNVNEVVQFDQVAPRILQLAAQVARAQSRACVDLEGSFGVIGAQQASALATVLAELVSNAVQHGTPTSGGVVNVQVSRTDGVLSIRVQDQGSGFEGSAEEKTESFSRGLGTRIIHAMVSGELGGTVSWDETADGGTVAQVEFRPTVEANGISSSNVGR